MKQITKNLRWLLASLLLVTGMSSAWGEEETIDFSAQGYTNAQQVTETTGTVVKATFTNGGTATAYYTTGAAVRVYNGGTMSITADGNEITKIVYTYELNGTATASVAGKNNAGTYNTTTKTWTGSDTEVVLTAGTAKHVRISKVVVTYTVSGGGSDPSISADNVDVAYNATSGQIAYTVNNPVTGGSVSATTTADWITLSSTTTSPIAFTCTANSGASTRTATVTLTYTYGSNTATKSVTVTQAGNPDVVNNISDITAAGTYTVKGTIVAKSTRGFIVGDGTGYVYYYNQNYDQSSYNIGDKVKLSGSVVVYGGVYEFNNSTTITAATESNYVEENPTVLSGTDMDSRVASTTPAQLSSYVQYEGTLTISGSYYNITSIDDATTAIGSISSPISTDFTSLDGQTVTVKGYYVGVSSSKYYNTMLGSIEAAAGFVAAPAFDVPEGEYSEAQTVTITCATEGASIYYTLDGSAPTTSSTLYDGTPLTISTTTTLKAIATDGTNVSEITSATYTIDTRTELFINEFYQDGTGNSIPAGSTITITVGETPEFTRAYPTVESGAGARLTQGEIVYTGDNDALGTVDRVSGEITLVAGATGTLTVTATFAGNTTYKPCTGFYKLKVKQEEVTPTGTGDEITHDFVGISGTSYQEWSGKTGTSGAVYAGNTSGGPSNENPCVQMRTNNNNSGIVTTTSGGKVTFVTVEWNDATSSSRTLDIYGSNTAYTSAADLYDSATQGTLLGSICVDDATQLAITGDYAYIGIRSSNGALYCDKITIYWDNPSGKQDPQLAYDPTTYSITEGDEFTSPELSNPHELTVTYTGDNDDLATVDASTGELTFISGATGEITVTATFEGDNTYNAGSASYTLTVYAQASGDELFNETFAGFAGKGGHDGQYSGSVGAGSTASGTDEDDWTFTSCGAADKCLKFGTGNGNGTFITRSIALTGNGTLTFSVAGWGSGTNSLAVTAEGGTLDGETEIALTNGDWTDHTIYINDADGELVLTFTGKRGFIDDIKVVSATSDPRTATTVTLDPATTSYNVILGDAFTAPTATLNPAAAGTLTYESSDETVATVDATGAVEILAAGTTTITAKFEGSEDYKPSQASYTLTVTEPSVVITSLQGLQEATTSTTAQDVTLRLTNIYVTAVKSDKKNAYISDGEYGALIYDSAGGLTLEAGKMFSGTLNVKSQLFKGSTEITNFDATGLTIQDGSMAPWIRTIDQITVANQSALVTLENVTYNGSVLSDGTNTITPYTTFMSNLGLESGHTYNITGIVIVYNTTIEIAPRTAEDIVDVTPETVELVATQDCYKTLYTPYDMDLEGSDLEAYIVTLNDEQNDATFVSVTKIPAETPVILHATTEGTYTLTRAALGISLDDVTSNELQVSDGNVTGDGTIYVLNKNPEIGFYLLNEGKTLAEGKCYLQIEKNGAKFIGFHFEGEATGIAGIASANDKLQGTVYNLAGQRVATPAHGLYIVNGKKVFIK